MTFLRAACACNGITGAELGANPGGSAVSTGGRMAAGMVERAAAIDPLQPDRSTSSALGSCKLRPQQW